MKNPMEQFTNNSGETISTWSSHRHPEHAHLNQSVRYTHIEYADGQNHLYWHCYNSSANHNHMIPNITLSEANARYSNVVYAEFTYEDSERWMAENK
jgi:hypothetical protein